MSSFVCETCGTGIIDTGQGYITECEHYPLGGKRMNNICLDCVVEFNENKSPCNTCYHNPEISDRFQSIEGYYPLQLKGTHIHLYSEDGNSKWTIALFISDKDGYFSLESIGDRILDKRVNWSHFEELVRMGFEIHNPKEEED